jgi:hypothetical protein
MAYVAISNALINDVEANINKLHGAEASTLPALKFDSPSAELWDHLLTKLWAPVAHLRTELTPYDTNSNVTAALNVPKEDKEKRIIGITFGDRKVPCISKAGMGYYSNLQVTVTEEDHPEFAAYAAAQRVHDECQQRWVGIRNKVVHFLENCKSLNEAVKLWPDVLRYVGQEYKDRMTKTVEKAKKDSGALEALRAIDLDTVASSTVIARMAGAKL